MVDKDQWHDALWRMCPPPGLTLEGQVYATCIEDLRIATSALRADPMDWTKHDVRHADTSHMVVWAQEGGSTLLRQAGAEILLRAGDIALSFTDAPFDLVTVGNERIYAFRIPFARLGLPEGRLHDRRRTGLHATSGRVAMTSAYLRELGRLSKDRAVVADHTTVNRTVDLLCWAFLSEADQAPTPTADEDAQVERIKQWADARLRRRSAITVAEVATAHAVSVRTLQRLFERNEVPLGEYLLQKRLEGLRDDLAEQAERNSTIAAIGSRWGFKDAPHLTRIFHERFGETPGAYRARHSEEGSKNSDGFSPHRRRNAS